ncbi:MAG: sulfurtransferase [Kineosporiaceae bacterium]
MTDPTAPRRAVLVDPADLAPELAGPRPPRLLDVRWALGAPHGLADHREAHLPGAVFVDLDEELSGPAAPGVGRHPLPDPERLQEAARRWGLRQGEPVVAYDATGNLAAARAWWVLRWAGVADVRLLDGGLQAWQEAGLPVESGEVVPQPGDVVVTPGRLPHLDTDDVLDHVREGGLLLDARPASRYRGEPNPIDPVLGHVPGAVSAPTTELLGADGRFLDAVALKARFGDLGAHPGRPVAVYCGSGVTAAHEIAALAVAGIDAVLYPGSWSQWATQPGRPVAVGEAPGDPHPPE